MCLQALLDVSQHFLTRLPDMKTTGEYRKDVRALGQAGILGKDFVDTAEKMAGYRNRLVHFYLDVSPKELYDILQNHLEDIAEFKRQLAKFVDEHKDDDQFLIRFENRSG